MQKPTDNDRRTRVIAAFMALSVEMSQLDVAFCAVVLDPEVQSTAGVHFQCVGNVKQEKVEWFLEQYLRILRDPKSVSQFQEVKQSTDLIQ